MILPGAGSGLRFDSDTPKQFQSLEGKLVIDYSIDLFLTFNECKKIIIALPDIHSLDEKVKKDERIKIIEGGDSRADSVREGFNVLMSLGHKQHILIHDVARPCLQLTDVQSFLNIFFPSLFLGSIPFTASSMMYSGLFLITSLNDLDFNPPGYKE